MWHVGEIRQLDLDKRFGMLKESDLPASNLDRVRFEYDAIFEPFVIRAFEESLVVHVYLTGKTGALYNMKIENEYVRIMLGLNDEETK